MDLDDIIHSPNRSRVDGGGGGSDSSHYVIHQTQSKTRRRPQPQPQSTSSDSRSRTTTTEATTHASEEGSTHTNSFIDDYSHTKNQYYSTASNGRGSYAEYQNDVSATDSNPLLGAHDVSSLAIYLKEKKLDAGLHDVKSVLKRLQYVLEEKETRIVGLESQCDAQSRTIDELHKEIRRLKRAMEDSKVAVEVPLRRQLSQVTEEIQTRLKDSAQLKKELDAALYNGQDYKKRAEIASNQAEDLRIGLEKLRADDLLIARAAANEEQLQEFSDARQGIRGKHENQLAVMEMKYTSLQNQCADLKGIKDELEDRLREAQIKNNEHSLKSQHRVLMESAEIHRKAQENINLEEQLHVAHVNNCRLLRLLMETSEFSNLVEFNSASQSFDFVRPGLDDDYSASSHLAKRGGGSSTGVLGCDVVSGSYHDPHTFSTRSKNVKLNKLSAKHQAMHSAIDCENEYIKSCRAPSGLQAGGSGSAAATSRSSGGALVVVPNADGTVAVKAGGISTVRAPVHAASGPAAFMCRPHPFYPTTDSGGPLRPRELIDFKQEAHYWIPHSAFIEAQKWRDAICPDMSINHFSPLFWKLNEIWRERMRQRLEVQARELQQQRKQQQSVMGHSAASSSAYGMDTSPPHVQLAAMPTNSELANLRREVKAKVFSRSALQLFDQYEMALKRLVARTNQLEDNYAISIGNQRREDDFRGPSDIVLRDRLDASANTARLVCAQLEQKLTSASQDVARFLRAVEDSAIPEANAIRSYLQRREGESEGLEGSFAASSSIPSSLLLRVVDFMLEFANEVTAQVDGASLSLRASADACDSVLLQQKEIKQQLNATAARHSKQHHHQQRVDGQNVSFENDEGHDVGVIRGGVNERRRVRGGGRGARAASASAGTHRRIANHQRFIPDEDDVLRV